MRLVIVMLRVATLSGTALEPFHFLHDGFVLRFQPGHALFHLPTFLLGFIVIPFYLHQSNLQLLKACFHTVALGLQLLGVCTHLGMRTVTVMMTDVMIVVMAAGLAANLTANPFEAVTTVTVQIVTLLVGDQEFDSAKTLAAFALGLMLFITPC